MNSGEDWGRFLDGEERESAAGIHVTHLSGLCLPALWSGILMIADDVSCLDYRVMERLEEGVDHDTDHPADFLINVQANPDMPSQQLWHLAAVHALLWGNGYVFVERQLTRNDPVGRPLGLFPLLPDRTWESRDADGDLVYMTQVVRTDVPLDPLDVVHIKMLQVVADRGLDWLRYARDTIGMGLAALGFASQFYRHGGRMGGILTVPPSTTEKAEKNLERDFRRKYEQPGEAFKVVVLEAGAAFMSAQATFRDTQMVEGRESDVLDIARLLRIPPAKLGVKGQSAFNSLEQAQRQYFQQAVMPVAKRIQRQCALRLLTDGQNRQRTHFIGVDTAAIISLDAETQNRVLEIQRKNSVITSNDWREQIGLKRLDDPAADELFNPNTTAGPGFAGGESVGVGGGEDPEPSPAARVVLADAVGRMARRLLARAAKLAAKPRDFAEWVDSALADQAEVVAKAMRPAAAVLGIEGNRAASEKMGNILREDIAAILAAYLEPPYAAADLPANVAEATHGLTDERIGAICDRIDSNMRG